MKISTVCVIPLVLVLGTLLFSCRSDSSQENGDSEKSAEPVISFEKRGFFLESELCEKDTMRCAKVEASYPVAVAGPDEAVQKINDTISYHLRSSLAVFAVEEDEVNMSIDTIAGRFIEEYETLTYDLSDYAIPWVVETKGEVLFQTEKLLSVELSNYSYAGGAHPNSFVTLLNFELPTGEKLELQDVIADIPKLTELVELKFRSVHELGPKEDLSDSGFFWGEGFSLPANFAVTGKGLYFIYNPYEAAAYALGPTEFTIEYDKLEGILKERFKN